VAPSLLEVNKKPGVHYAVTVDGIELPVVDVTHPAFLVSLSESEQQTRIRKFLNERPPFAVLPRFLRTRLLQVFLRGSVLSKGIRASQGSFMRGMDTYLLKLGPQMLGAYATPIDRRIAASLPSLSVRLRLQDMARLMADALRLPLSRQPRRPLQFINIAGGPAIDSLNALIVIQKNDPAALRERPVSIDVLDLDEAGPKFGQAALSALSRAGAPLHGTQLAFRHIRYDWSNPAGLKPVLDEARAQNAIVIGSSEGGLFEYGSDEQIQGNLEALRGSLECFVGSVTRDDETMKRLMNMSTAATRPRGITVFRELARNAGWEVSRFIERPLSDQVVLTPNPHLWQNRPEAGHPDS